MAVLEHLNCHESLYKVFPDGCILGYDPAHHSPAAPVAPRNGVGSSCPPSSHTWPRPSSPPLVEPGPTGSLVLMYSGGGRGRATKNWNLTKNLNPVTIPVYNLYALCLAVSWRTLHCSHSDSAADPALIQLHLLPDR